MSPAASANIPSRFDEVGIDCELNRPENGATLVVHAQPSASPIDWLNLLNFGSLVSLLHGRWCPTTQYTRGDGRLSSLLDHMDVVNGATRIQGC